MQLRKNGNHIWDAVVLGYIILAFAILAYTLVIAVEWQRLPFWGRYLEPNMLISPNVVMRSTASQAFSHLDPFDKIVLQEINQQAVTSQLELESILKTIQVGDSMMVTVRQGELPAENIQIIAENLSTIDRLVYFYFPYLVAWAFFIMGLWSYWIQRMGNGDLSFPLFSTSMVIVLSLIFDLFSTHQLFLVWLGALALSAATLLQLMLRLTHWQKDYARTITIGGYLVSILVFLVSLLTFNRNSDHPFMITELSRWVFLFTGIVYIFSILIAGPGLLKSRNPTEKQRGRLFVIGGLASFGPIGVWIFGSAFGLPMSFSPWYLLPMILFPLMVGYSSQRYRMLRTSYVASRTVQFGLLAILVSVGYALFVAGLGVIFQGRFNLQNPLLLGAIIFILSLAFNPIKEWLEKSIDLIFFRGEQGIQRRLNTFSGDLTSIVNLEEIIKLLQKDIQETVQPEWLHIFLYDALSETYLAFKSGPRRTSDFRFSKNSALVRFLENETAPQYISLTENFPPMLEPDKDRLALLGVRLFIPLQGQQQLLGWLGLSDRYSGEPYTGRELNYLDSLADQASLAIERSQVIGNLERRVNEMNVLTRVAQGVNYTIALDDIYELIYAQTTQIIPTDDFYIILRDMNTQRLIQVFCVEKQERIFENEKKALPSGTTLEEMVVTSRRPMRATDYKQVCLENSTVMLRDQIGAIMLVPLNTGAETIGVIVLASRLSNQVFSSEQMNLMQAISDQAAGAIVKARLLQETERRARQLTTLNELTRQLTSTLALAPLLENVLRNSVEILNCEAGSLLMVDEETQELVFRVALGPVAEDLLNKRLAPGTGVVGKAVDTRQPQIVNNVADTPDWFSKTDEQTGFRTRSLLVVPLIVKNEILGVIEVLNRLDGLPFSKNDQDILSAFAAQASVALENANLYTRTDQALADRVEELSVMQRIDRELNTSLDLQRAMRITLTWALRQSNAQAGLIGLVQAEGIRIVESEGYQPEQLETYKKTLLPATFYGIDSVLANGQPLQTILKPGQTGIAAQTRSQIIIPVLREQDAIALLLLESTQDNLLNENEMNFLMRLSDHASIALVNGQLYAEVQSANVAKSEFVSFVAHELKNPMTSIKGYTELLAAGAVGAVNEAQAGFLGTIRSNIDRMNTLVSDLNDLSKIEAGRLRLDFRAVKIIEIVEEAVRSTKRQIEDKQQSLIIELDKDLPQVWADTTRLSQVVVNLVSNAHKYTEAGGAITVAAEVAANQWDTEGAAQVVHLWVSDTGIGITPEDQKKIFQKFFRSEDPKTREVPGTGLGLNITRSLVEMQGGKIWFESEFRKGTIFHITVPIAG
jgi:signal transduction histidine kinase